jgi:hypothetical protein
MSYDAAFSPFTSHPGMIVVGRFQSSLASSHAAIATDMNGSFPPIGDSPLSNIGKRLIWEPNPVWLFLLVTAIS